MSIESDISQDRIYQEADIDTSMHSDNEAPLSQEALGHLHLSYDNFKHKV